MRHSEWLGATLLLCYGLTTACNVDFSRTQHRCGDGVIGDNEACDDGNELPADGCDECQLEQGWQCTGSPSVCVPECGNGALVGDEVCDGPELDGYTCEDHGFYEGVLACAPDCSGFDTTGCNGRCGDGALSGPEVCDGTRLGDETCDTLDQYPGTLTCLADCTDYDTSGCGGACGDGVVNGTEVCDGSALASTLCSDLGAFYGGPLTCEADCWTFDTSGCWTEPRVVINEIGLAVPDWVELLSLSEVPVQLTDWTLRWYVVNTSGNANSGTWVLPPFTAAPHERILLVEDPGIAGDSVVDATRIRFKDNIPWIHNPGAALLTDDADTTRDFVRWGSAQFNPPAVSDWTEDQGFLAAPGAMTATMTLSRVPDGGDSNRTSDWCVSPGTPDQPNDPACIAPTPAGTILITEVHRSSLFNLWAVEIYNTSSAAIDLDGWSLLAGTSVSGPVYLAPYLLASGQHLEIRDNAGSLAPFMDLGDIMHVKDLGAVWQLNSLALVSPIDFGCVDFVRWAGSNTPPPSPCVWADTPAPLPTVASGESLGRTLTTDMDEAGDWCLLQAASLGAVNGACAP